MPASSRPAPLALIVEDDLDSCEMYAEFLKHAGFEVRQAHDGGQAVKQAIALEPDVVLMDLSLPVLDGLEASRLLRANERLNGTAIVLLTGHVLQDTAAEMPYPFDSFLLKPCLPDDILTAIHRAVAARARQRDAGPV